MRGYHGRRRPLLPRRRGIAPREGRFIHIPVMTREELGQAAFMVFMVVVLVAGLVVIAVFFAGVRW